MVIGSLFAGPGEDPKSTYERLRVSSNPVAIQARQITDQLWATFEPYADANFPSELRRDFHSRFWEMYLTFVLLGKGFDIECRKPGPDILIRNSTQRIWIEAIAPTPGASGTADRVPGLILIPTIVQEHPEIKILLRYRAAIREKFDNKYMGYLQQGIITNQDPYIIAVNSSKIPSAYPDFEIPAILKAVFPIGNLQIRINREDGSPIDSSLAYRPSISKASGASVDTDIFMNPTYEPLTGIIFSHTSANRYKNNPGSDFLFVHNPISRNHVPEGFFGFGVEYIPEDKGNEYVLRKVRIQ